MNPEKLQPIPESTEAPRQEATAFEAFGKRGQRPGDKEKKEPQIESEQAISLAREAEEAFARNDFNAALEKLRELQRAASPEGTIESEYHEQLLKEFERQVSTLSRREYAEAAKMEPDEFAKLFEPLKEYIREIAQREKEAKEKEGHIPFVLVIKNDVIGGEKAMPLIELEGKKGFTGMSADDIKGFKPYEVKLPEGKAYLAIDIETGKTTLGKTPDEAIKQIKKEDRSALTVEEVVALITHHPEILKDHNVWASGSRHGGGKVADVWLDEGRPELVWDGSDDSNSRWGSASCGSRVGP
jgi:hypothetical protein